MCDAKLDQVLDELRLAREDLAVQQALIAEDRVQISRLLVLANRLMAAVESAAQKADVIADDLAAAVGRADAAPDTPGASADAALRSAEE